MKKTIFLSLLALTLAPNFARAEASAVETAAAATILGGAGCWLGGGIGLVPGAIAASATKNPQTAERLEMAGAVVGCAVGGSIGVASVVQAAEAPSEDQLQADSPEAAND